MSGHQSTADMVNNELDQLQDMMNPGIDTMLADMDLTQDFSGAPDIHGSLENNTQTSTADFGGHGNTSIWLKFDAYTLLEIIRIYTI